MGVIFRGISESVDCRALRASIRPSLADDFNFGEFLMDPNLGRPALFDIDKYLDVVEMMILAEEVERAFWMLDNVPGWFRDNEPERLKDIRLELHKCMFTPIEYAHSDRIPSDTDHWAPRGDVVAAIVETFNVGGTVPHVMELSPGSRWLEAGLKRLGREFSYESRSLTMAPEPVHGGGPNIFVCFETLEHMSNPMELYQAYLKFQKKAQYIVLSVPLYTWFGGMREWKGQALGHLRTYTPCEFKIAVKKLFPGYELTHNRFDADCTQVILGVRP